MSKTGTSNKSPKTSLMDLLSPSGQNKVPTLVPPVLREVGKLAAGVASVSTNNAGSATGNPRNKCALQPGHSLMDWIRLGASGKDLTSLGAKAGNLPVTKQELAIHNKRDDAWLAIRGKVYCITHYIPFHPGGEDELMRGAGIDATDLFNEIHPWVNYEQILQKCLLGRLVVSVDPAIDAEALFFGETKKPSTPKSTSEPSNNTRLISPPSSLKDSDKSSKNEPQPVLDVPETITSLPRFDWIQKMEYITVIFYTKAFSNPFVELFPPTKDKSIIISITYDGMIYKNEIVFHKDITWPCEVKLTIETGKIELIFKKAEGNIWENYGVLRQGSKEISVMSAFNAKSDYILKNKLKINYNSYLLKFERQDGVKAVVPIGKHVRVFRDNQDDELSRSYTPVPECLFSKYTPHSTSTDLCLMVKRYSDGNLSKFVTDKQENDTIRISKPIGNFDLRKLEKRETFLLLAAGTGITPILTIVTFLLERRIKKCQFVRLLFFNRTEEDILLRNQIESLAQHDNRFYVAHILSEPDNEWKGLSGHVNAEILENCLQEHLKDTGYTIQDIFSCICGPKQFNIAAYDSLTKVGLDQDQIHKFEG